MKRLFFSLLFFAILYSANFPQSGYFSIGMYPPSPDTQYVLPGEFWHIQNGIQSANPNNRLVSVNSHTYFDELVPFMANNYNLFTQAFVGGDTLNTWRFNWHNDSTMFQLRWVPNYIDPGFIQNWLWLYSFDVNLAIPAGQTATFASFVNAGEPSGQLAGAQAIKTLIGIDGIRGDVNRDGLIDSADVQIMFDYFDHQSASDYARRYTATGENAGLGCILFSCPDEISLALLNLYVHNPNEPLVQGLGIGHLFSSRGTNKVPVAFRIDGSNLIIDTDGDIVNICGYSEHGALWQKTLFVSGQAQIQIPKLRGVTVEGSELPGGTLTGIQKALALPASFSLAQNYPNPFNPATTIRYDLPQADKVYLAVYDMLGREVAVLADIFQAAGSHTVNFDASELSSGTYIYRLIASQYQVAKKMCLIK